MALGTIVTQVKAITSNAYGNLADNIKQAYYYCSAKLGGDIVLTSGTVGSSALAAKDNEGMAVAMLASVMLANGRLHSKPDGIPKTIDELYTTEIADMLLTPEETDEDIAAEGVMWSNDLPTDNWEVL